MRTSFVLLLVALIAVQAKKPKEQKEKAPKAPRVEEMPCPAMREQAMAQMDPLSRANAEYNICKQNCLLKHHQQQMQMTTEQKVEQLRKELADAEAFLGTINQGKDGSHGEAGDQQHLDSQHAHPAAGQSTHQLNRDSNQMSANQQPDV